MTTENGPTGQYEQLLELQSKAKAYKEFRTETAGTLEHAGLETGQIPSGFEFFFSYLFQPFRLSLRIFTATGLFPSGTLSDFARIESYQDKLLGIDFPEARRYVRRIVLISLVILLIPLSASLIWARPWGRFWYYIGSVAAVFFFQVLAGKLRGCLNVALQIVLIALLVGLYVWLFTILSTRFYTGPPPRTLAIDLGVVAFVGYRVSSPRVIALCTTVAVVLGGILLLVNGTGNFLTYGALGLVAGLFWDSADIVADAGEFVIVGEKKPKWRARWRYIMALLIFFGLLLFFSLSAIGFNFVPGMYKEQVMLMYWPMLVGFMAGYLRLTDTLLINLYQLALYLFEKFTGTTTIQRSPVLYHDAHDFNLMLAPHLIDAYRHDPDEVRKVLNACALAPSASKLRKRVLRELTPDAFLSFNSKNRNEARKLAGLLGEKGLNIWYDAKQLRLGRGDWERDINEAIMYCKAVLILIGADGYGSYQEKEVNFSLAVNFEQQLPIIPIFLPGAEIQDERLKKFTFVDLRTQSPESLFGDDTVQRIKVAVKPG